MEARRKISPIATEHEESVTFAGWLDFKGFLYSKIPSETYTTSWKQKNKNKTEGVHKGVPDYLIVMDKCRLGRAVLLFVEMKKTKGGKISPEQKMWIESLNKVADVEAVVCKGAEEAIRFIKELE